MQRNGLKRCPAGGGPDPAQPDRKWEAPSPTISGAGTAQIGRQPRALRLLARWSTPEHAAAQGAALLPGREVGHDHALDLTREGLGLLHPVVLLRAPPPADSPGPPTRSCARTARASGGSPPSDWSRRSGSAE